MKFSQLRKSAASAGLCAIALTVAATLATPVEAKIYTGTKFLNKDKCYMVKRIPATIEYNTRGIKVRDESKSWVGNFQKDGSKVKHKHNDAVFIQTSRILEDQHVTLVPSKCH